MHDGIGHMACTPLATMHAPFPPGSHTCPLATTHASPATMHAPHHTCSPSPRQPCMPPSPWQPHTPLATMHAPQQPHMPPQQPCMPPSNHAHPPATMHAPWQPHMLPATMHTPSNHTRPPQPHMSPPDTGKPQFNCRNTFLTCLF